MTRDTNTGKRQLGRKEIEPESTVELLSRQGRVVETLPVEVDRLVAAMEAPTMWVSASRGRAEGTGSYRDPVASIGAAIRELKAQEAAGEFEAGTVKHVMVEHGEYTEGWKTGFLLNTVGWRVIGLTTKPFRLVSGTTVASPASDMIVLSTAETGPCVLATNMTDDEVADYFDVGGGPDFTSDPVAGTYTYTGPDLVGRARTHDPSKEGFAMNLAIENFQFAADEVTIPNGNHALAACLLGVPNPDTLEGGPLGLVLAGLRFFGGSTGVSFFMRNIAQAYTEIFNDGGEVWDNCIHMTAGVPRVNHVPGSQAVPAIYAIHADDAATAGQPFGAGTNEEIFDFVGMPLTLGFNVEVYSDQNPSGSIFDSPIYRAHNDLVLAGTGSWGTTGFNSEVAAIEGGDVTVRNSFDVFTHRVAVQNWTHDSTGQLTINEGGIIEGNLTVSAAGAVTLRGVVVGGNLDVQDAGATLDLADVVVLGDVTFPAGMAAPSWKGGSFHGTLTDPDGHLTGFAAGDYVAV